MKILIDINPELVERLAKCSEHVHRVHHSAKVRVTRADVMRAALSRGLLALEHERDAGEVA